MSELAVLPPSLIAPTATPTAAELSKRKDISTAAESFESSFLSIMMQQMFEGVEVSAPFGGGQGETMFRSFMTDAFAKQTAKAGGLGIADVVAKEMLKMQGLE
jgi:Rod binding domain-containing protein